MISRAIQAALDGILLAPAPAAIADPAPDQAAVTEQLLALACAKPWRRSAVDEATRADARRKIRAGVDAGLPVEFSLPFGGYKSVRQPSGPNLNWAEVFWLAWLRRYARRLADIHAPGVVLSMSYFHGVLGLVNNLPLAVQDRYIGQLGRLCDHTSGGGVTFRVVDLSEAYGGAEGAVAAILDRYDRMRADGADAVGPAALGSAARNVLGLADPAEEEVREAAWRCLAMESLEPRRAFNKFSSRIQITHIRGAGLSLHLGSCRTSTMQPWVGTGVLEPDGAGGWRERILNAADTAVAASLEPLPVRHPLGEYFPGLATIPVRHG